MAVEQEIDAGRGVGRRDVNEPRLTPGDLEIERHRPLMRRVTVPAHDFQRASERLELEQRPVVAHVAEVPDFIRLGEQAGEMRGDTIVSVGDDGDSHAPMKSARGRAGKPAP